MSEALLEVQRTNNYCSKLPCNETYYCEGQCAKGQPPKWMQ
jgi:hypothetical protein